MADLSSVTTNLYATAQEGFTTTTSSSVASGATTVALTGVGDYVDGDVVALTIEPASASAKQVFTGVISGLNVTNVKWTEGTNQAHAAGSTVIDYVSATHQAMQTKASLVHSNSDGTLKTSAVTAALTTGTVTTAMLADGGVTGAKLATSAITLGYTQITSSFSTASTSPVQVTGLTATVTIPAGGRRVRISTSHRGLTNTSATPYMAISIWDGTVGSGTLLARQYAVAPFAGAFSTPQPVAIVTPAAGSKTYNIGFEVQGGTGSLTCSATEPAFILVEAI